jgi:hypothetical protein
MNKKIQYFDNLAMGSNWKKPRLKNSSIGNATPIPNQMVM